MISKSDSLLVGIKFMDTNNKTFLACGYIDNANCRDNLNVFQIVLVVLSPVESVLGIKSAQRGTKFANHFDF